MRAFRTDMTRHRMVKRAGGGAFQHRRRRRADEAIEDHRNPGGMGSGNRPRHRRNLAPAKAGQHHQRVRQHGGMARDPVRHDPRLQRHALVIDPRAAPGPITCRTAEQRRRNRRRRGGVGNPHLAHHQKIGRRIDRLPADSQRRHHLGLGHRRCGGEIGGRSVKLQRMHIKARPEGLGQLVDRRPPGAEIRHHLGRHFGRKG